MTALLLPAENLALAVDALRHGKVVAYPTETFYGLAVDPFFPGALEKIIFAKKRDAVKPVLVLIDQLSRVTRLVSSVPPGFYDVVARFWPGPLTLVLPAHATVPDGVTGNTGTVGVRISSHPVAHELVRRFGAPITSTSANCSGRQPMVTAVDVSRDLGDVVDMVIDGGPCPGGLPSTLVALDEHGARLVREGVVAFSAVCEALQAGNKRAATHGRPF